MNKPRILIVEDDSLVAFDLQRIILGLGYEVTGMVALGREAIAIAAAQAPDAVLMDISLQGSLDGIETARLIKEQSDIPIIYVTAYADSKTLQRAKLADPFGYVLKPFDDEIIRVTLEMALYKHKIARELQVNQDRLRLIVEHLPIGAVYREDDTILLNKAVEEMTGYARSEINTPDQWFSALFGKNAATARDYYKADRQANFADPRTVPVTRKDGQIRLIEFNGYKSEQGEVWLLNDITERQQAEKQLRFQADLLDQVNDTIVVLDNAGRIVYWNRGAQQLYGWTAAEVMGQPLTAAYDHRWLNPGDKQAANTALATMGVWQGEIVHIKKDGTEIFVESSTSRLVNEQGEVVGLVAVNRDITERRRLEAQLLESLKMDTIGRLAGGIAHDFNNLLTVMIGYTDLALANLPADHQARPDIIHIQKSAVRAAKLTGQLLAFSRQQMIEPQLVSLNHLILNLKEILQRLIGEDIELVTKLTAETDLVKIDPHQFEQVLVNLAANARDAMPAGGKFILETTLVPLDRHEVLRFDGLSPGSYVVLAAGDTGTGISQEILTHLFEPFFTTKEVGKGTGLGLAMCHGIVKQTGGDIKVYSELNQGTTFKIYLPKVNAPSLPTLQTPDVTIRPGSETILLVEDEAVVRNIAFEALSRLGYTVLSAPTGTEALTIVEGRLDDIDLVVTDVVMPQMSGRQLAEKLQALRPALKVLYMSGHTETAMLNQGFSNTGVAFLAKPFTPNLLAYMVREVLDT
jgi:PAS domain S-box-containing protein